MTSAAFVFVHGGGQGGWVWDETIAALHAQDPDCTTLALDAPGCGAKRGRAIDGLSVRDVGAELAEDLAASGLTDVVLVGHSNAGTLLPVIAKAAPRLVRRLVYVSCIAPAAGTTVLEEMSRSSAFVQEDDLNRRLRAMFCNDMAPAEADAFIAKLGQDHWPTMAAIAETARCYDHLAAIPSTYVRCLEDRALPLDWQVAYAERLACDRIVRIDAGHQAMNTRPHALAEILRHEAAA